MFECYPLDADASAIRFSVTAADARRLARQLRTITELLAQHDTPR